MLVGVLSLIVLATVPTIWERAVARPYLRDSAGVPHAPVAVVFGALLDGDRPSYFLATRLNVAANLFARRVVPRILVSGNDNGHGYDEPDAMRRYLVTHGVPADRIVTDRAGFDTWDTCARAHDVFGVRQAILVTQTFHVARAVTLCRANGVDGWGVGIDSRWTGLTSTYYGYFREYFAADKAMWQVLVARPHT